MESGCLRGSRIYIDVQLIFIPAHHVILFEVRQEAVGLATESPLQDLLNIEGISTRIIVAGREDSNGLLGSLLEPVVEGLTLFLNDI